MYLCSNALAAFAKADALGGKVVTQHGAKHKVLGWGEGMHGFANEGAHHVKAYFVAKLKVEFVSRNGLLKVGYLLFAKALAHNGRTLTRHGAKH